MQARKALADRQKDLEVKTQQLEIKLSNKTEEDIKKARRKSTQAGQRSPGGLDGLHSPPQKKVLLEKCCDGAHEAEIEVWKQRPASTFTCMARAHVDEQLYYIHWHFHHQQDLKGTEGSLGTPSGNQ